MTFRIKVELLPSKMDRKKSPRRKKSNTDLHTHGLHIQDISFSLPRETLSNNQNQRGSCNQGKQAEVGQTILDVATLLFVIKLCGPNYTDLVTILRSYVNAPQTLSSDEGMGLHKIRHSPQLKKENEDSCKVFVPSDVPNADNCNNKFDILVNKLQELVENITTVLYHLNNSFKGFPDIVRERVKEMQVEACDLKHVACTEDDKIQEIEEERKTIKKYCENLWNLMSIFSEDTHILLRELDRYENKKILQSQKKIYLDKFFQDTTSANDNEPHSLSSAEGMGTNLIRENHGTFSSKSLHSDSKNQDNDLNCSIDEPSQQTASQIDSEVQSLHSSGGMVVPQTYPNLQLGENVITNSHCSKPCFEDGENQTIKLRNSMVKPSQQAESLKINEPRSLSSAEGMDIPRIYPPFQRIWK